MWGAGMLPSLFAMIIYINLLLAIFNLIPIPPLDGSKVLMAFFPRSEGVYRVMRVLEQYGFMILLILIFAGGLSFIRPIVSSLFSLIVGGGLGG